MKATRALALGVLGAAALVALLPRFETAQPRGLALTRPAAVEIADAEARRLGIPIDKAFRVETWDESLLVEQEVAGDAATRLALERDPVVGPRLGAYRVTYFRKGLEKYPEFGYVLVGKDGVVLGARVRARAEETGGRPTEAEVRAAADRVRRLALLPGRPVARVRRRPPERPEGPRRPRPPLPRPVRRAARDGLVLPERLLRRRPPLRLGALRGVRRRPRLPVRARRQHRHDARPLRRRLRAPLRPPRHLPEEVPRGRGRRRDGSLALRRAAPPLPRPRRSSSAARPVLRRRPRRHRRVPDDARPGRASASSSSTSRSRPSSSSPGPSARATPASAGASGSPPSTPSCGATPSTRRVGGARSSRASSSRPPWPRPPLLPYFAGARSSGRRAPSSGS